MIPFDFQVSRSKVKVKGHVGEGGISVSQTSTSIFEEMIECVSYIILFHITFIYILHDIVLPNKYLSIYENEGFTSCLHYLSQFGT